MDHRCACAAPVCPPACEAYVALGACVPGRATVLFSPQRWCSRPLLVGERVRVGDEHGRRAQAFVLGEAVHPDEPSVVGYDFLIGDVGEW